MKKDNQKEDRQPTDAEMHYRELMQFFKHLVWLVGGAVAIIVAVASAFLAKSIKDVKLDAEASIVAVKNSATSQIEKVREEAGKLAIREAQNQIEEIFEQTNVVSFVEAAAKKQVGEAVERQVSQAVSKVMATHIEPVVANFRADVEGKLRAIEIEQDFLGLATRARAYDYIAYLRLREMGTRTNEIGDAARQVVAEMDRALETERLNSNSKQTSYGRSGFRTVAVRRPYEVAGNRRYGGAFASDEIAKMLFNAKDNPDREGIVLAARELKQPLFLEQLVELICCERDLRIADQLAQTISTLARQKFYPKDVDQIKSWRELSKNTYTNWPYSEFQKGVSEFFQTNYAAAAISLEHVLSLDPAADKSRALTIACYWETGDTNKAFTHTTQFRDPRGRWYGWAETRALAETNSSLATTNLATLYRQSQTLSDYISEQLPTWRRIDWRLFRQLTGETKP